MNMRLYSVNPARAASPAPLFFTELSRNRYGQPYRGCGGRLRVKVMKNIRLANPTHITFMNCARPMHALRNFHRTITIVSPT